MIPDLQLPFLRTLPSLLALAGLGLLIAVAQACAAEPIYSVYSTMIPSQALGGFSPYQNVTPEVTKSDGDGIASVLLPARNARSVSLVFWYANHTKSRLGDWPQGDLARAQLVVRPAQDATLDLMVALETGAGWAGGATVESVRLLAGTDTTVYLPLPENARGVGRIRVGFSAGQDSVPALEIKGLSAGSLATASLRLPDENVWRTVNPVRLDGRAEGKAGERVSIRAFDAGNVQVAEWTPALDAEGAYSFEVDRASLPAGRRLTLSVSAPGKAAAPGDYAFFVFPVIDPAKKLARVARQGRDLVLDGKPYAFLGVNYTPFLLGLSRRANYGQVAQNFQEMSDWGIQAIRVPLAMAMIQPAPGVFPDSPEYADTLRQAGLDPRFFDLLRYAAELGHHYGIRIVFDWHESMTDPYRYFLGGRPEDTGTGKPGTPLAWLAMPESEYPKEDHPLFITMENPRHRQALFETTHWLARAFKGDGVILGFEVPYNEPHERTISNDRNWRRLTVQAAHRVKLADPGMLTFGMPAGWGHENVFISSTWLPPDQLDGMTPHFYVGNGPIPVRPDADQRRYPYLAREVEPSLSLGLTALSLPYTAVDHPIYNGEGGGHGAESFLPDLPLNQATRIMIEAQIFQAYATGMAGYFEWTMWNNNFWRDTTAPNKPLFQRYAPVFRAGPLNFHRASVLFVQNPGADSNANGHNFAAVRFAHAVLDLHLQPAHYMTDDQLIFTGQTMFSRGFEQVDASGEGLGSYQAIIVDTRNVDKRALDIVRGADVPVLEFDEANPASVPAIAAFLEEHGVPFDRRTPAQFQIARGPRHLVVYRRSAGDATRVHPLLDREGAFSLVAEDGRQVFTGTAAQLAADGFEVRLEKWASAIFRIEDQK